MDQSSTDDLTLLSLAFEDALKTQLPKRSDSFKSIGVGSESEQSKRREKLLERQKQSRRDLRNHARSIAHDEQPSRGAEFKRKRELEDDSVLPGEPSTKAYAISYDLSRELAEENKKRIEERVRQKYSNILMLPEEMLEVPDDIQENWFAVPLPVGGKRCAVYSAKGRTTSRLRNGAILHRFNSNLPGGNTAKGSTNNPSHYCILDCIFHEPTLTYFVLDINCWKGNLYYDCDTGFRNYWLHSKLSECLKLDQRSAFNEYSFVPLPYFDCSAEGIQQALNSTVPQEKGSMLFYHKESIYTFGLTPLVLHLAVDHVSELLAKLESRNEQMKLSAC